MPPVRPQVALVRSDLIELLDGPARTVALAGPFGAGVSTALRQWADTQREVLTVSPAHVLEVRVPRTTGTAIVIDDADRLVASDWTHLLGLLDDCPALRIRLGLRSLSSIPRDAEIEVVRNLAFSPDELVEYLTSNGSRVDPGALYSMTAGHPGAVRAIVTSGVTRRDRFSAVLAASAGGARLPDDDAVLAIPRSLSPALVAELGGDAEFIERAERAGLGGWNVAGDQPVFLLTPLVRASTLAAHRIPADQRRAVRQRAALQLLDEHAWFEAIVEATESGRLDLVDRALKRGGMPVLWAHGRALLWTLRAIPVVQLRRWPVIAMAQALIANARRQHAIRAAELMGVALIGIQTSPRDSPDRALLRTIESVARRLTGIGDGGVKAARTAARMLDEMAPAALDDLSGLIGDLRVHSGISLLYAGHLDEAHTQFEHAAAAPSRIAIELMAVGGAAMVEALQGDIHSARRWTSLAEGRTWPPDILDEYAGSMLRIAQAVIALEDGDPDRAAGLLATIWPIIDTIEHWPILGYVRALTDIHRGAPGDGLEALRALRQRRGKRLAADSPTARMLDLAASTLALAAGDMTTASRLEPGPSDRPWIWLGAARVAVFEGDHDRAFRLLGRADTSTTGDRLTRLTLEAVLLRRLGRDEDAVTVARRADALVRNAELITPLVLLPASERDLFTVDLPRLPGGLEEVAPAPRLTERELVVLRQLFETARVEDIAARLHVSANTVKSQRRSLYRKLGATTREEALARAMAHGLTGEAVLPTRAISGTESSTPSDARPNSSS